MNEIFPQKSRDPKKLDTALSSKDRVIEQFGLHADQYVTSVTHARGADLAPLVEGLRPDPHAIVLDVATGGGHVANALAPNVRQVVALDLTRPMLEAAKAFSERSGHSNILFVQGDAESLPFADNSFDIVACRIAAHHFPNPEHFVSQVARVLKPLGRFGLIDNIAPEAKDSAEFINHVEKLRDVSHVWCHPISAWTAWLNQAGFQILHQESWPKRYQFASWVARMADTVEQRERVAAALRSAPAEWVKQFAIVQDGADIVSFETTQWMGIAALQG